MKDAKDIEAIFGEFLPWSDPKIEGLTAELASIRPVGPDFAVTVNFLMDGARTGYVGYMIFPEEDRLHGAKFEAGAGQGRGLLRHYADDSIEVFLGHYSVLSTKLVDSRIRAVYEDAGWQQDEDDETLWWLRPDQFTRVSK